MTTLLKQNGRVTDAVDLTVFKVVRDDRTSDVSPASRPELPGYETTRGEKLYYGRGYYVTSRSGPGIMAYRTEAEAYKALAGKSDRLVVALRITAGTPYWEGAFSGKNCILVDAVTVLN